MAKDLSTPIIDAARERQAEVWRQIDALPPLRWWTWTYWRIKWWMWRH